ncbi:probable carboxylesterase 17 [Phalaenopsis equestris]|uniref:probable carboxylesterase 17 n=1 Tax=Phalaenopsis equestris TaxID=78828 RepID=UPI0009E5297F|nr:probable carboxylesterase 17 [Phalaenopsis equestris]
MVSSPANKHLVDEISGWLRVFDDGSVDRTWTGAPEALQLMSSVPPHSDPIDGLSLIDLPGNPTLRFYLPSHLLPNAPILLHFHGGGFCISHFSWLMYHHFYANIARSLPAIVVSVQLPLAPEQRLPAAYHVAFQALLRLRDATPPLTSLAHLTRVFLIGDSSGANIVHELSVMVGRAEEKEPGFWSPIKVAGGIAIHPGFVRSTPSPSEMKLEWETPFLTLDMLNKFLALALPEGAGKEHPYTCPMGKLAPPMEGLKLPPMMVVVAEKDLIRDTEMEYCEAMKKAGKEVQVFFQTDVGHSFYLNIFAVEEDDVTRKRTQELILAIKDFVDRH